MYEHAAAEFLSREAHGLRNHLATLRAVEQLLEDAEVAADVAVAACAMQLHIERSITAARVELGERPVEIEMPLGQLLALAYTRARREGFRGDGSTIEIDEAVSASVITGPGSWLERIFTDMVHVQAIGTVLTCRPAPASVELMCTVEPDQWARIATVMCALAEACSVQLTCDDAQLTCVLPRADRD